MNELKLLLVEDEDSDIDVFNDSVKVFNKTNDCEVCVVVCKNLESVNRELNSSFDGAIVDLKLNIDTEAGNEIIKRIHDDFRIPVAVCTATPSNINEDFTNFVKIYKKGEKSYKEILDDLNKIYKTGLTKIVGGRGVIERTMNKVFWENIIPHLNAWELHVTEGKDTEKALLRYTINHLHEHLDDGSDSCYPEETYILPPATINLKTGSLVMQKETNIYYVVLSPACDLFLRKNGSFKTDSIMFCQIEDFKTVRDRAFENITKAKDKKEKVENLIKNNVYAYYHWLPSIKVYPGGFINFRKILALSKDEFEQKFNVPTIQITSHFIKDIISRYSTYYARQGQPDFAFNELSKKLI
jgi:CheY-like chemotaxis protein